MLRDSGRWRALAAALVGKDDADDVLQEVNLRLMRRPPDEPRAPGAWLRTITIHTALEWLRRKKTRARHERGAARPEPITETAEAPGERLAVQRQLLEAVDRLAEPYRTTVIERWFDELTPGEIATRLGVPASTVRNRLMRAHAELRKDLDRRFGARSAWALAFVRLSDPKIVGAGTKTVAVAGIGGATIMLGLKSKLAIATVAVLLLTFAWTEFGDGRSDDALAPSNSPSEAGAHDAAAPEARRVADAAPTITPIVAEKTNTSSAERAAAAESAPISNPTYLIVGRILCDEKPAGSGSRITVTAIAKDLDRDTKKLEATADAGGTFTIDATEYLASLSSAVEFEFDVDHGDFLHEKVRAGIAEAVADAAGKRTLTVTARMSRAAVVTGRIVDSSGHPVEKCAAGIFLESAKSGTTAAPTDSCRTDADGRFRLRTIPEASSIVLVATEDHRPSHRATSARIGEPVDLGDIALSPGLRISGRVLLSGRPVKAGAVEANLDSNVDATGKEFSLEGRTFALVGSRIERAYVKAFLGSPSGGSEGAFSIDGLGEVPYVVTVSEVDQLNLHMSLYESVRKTVTAPATDCELDLSGGSLRVRVRAEGQPCAGASIELYEVGVYSVDADENGEGRFFLAFDVEHEVVVEKSGFEPFRKKFTIPKGAPEKTIDVDLLPIVDGHDLEVIVEDVGGSIIKNAAFGFFRVNDDFPQPEKVWDLTSTDGTFRIKNPKIGRWRLVVRAGGNWRDGTEFFCEESCEIDVTATSAAAAHFSVHRGGRVRVTIKDDTGRDMDVDAKLSRIDGTEIPVVYCSRSPGGGSISSPKRLNSPCEIENVLSTGDYRLTLTEKGFRTAVIPITVRAGEVTAIDLALEKAD